MPRRVPCPPDRPSPGRRTPLPPRSTVLRPDRAESRHDRDAEGDDLVGEVPEGGHVEEPAPTVEERAERQYGRFTLEQAIASGLSRTTIYRRTRANRYLLDQPGVFRFAGVPDCWEGSILAACLAAGGAAVASH